MVIQNNSSVEITDFTNITIVNTDYEYNMSNNQYYTPVIVGIGIAIFIILMSIFFKALRRYLFLLTLLAVSVVVLSMAIGVTCGTNSMTLKSTTYTFKTSSEDTLKAINDNIGQVTYDEYHGEYTVTKYE